MSERSSRVLIGLAVFVVSLAVYFRVPFLPTIGVDIGMSDTQLAGITTAFAVGRVLIDLPAGQFADRLRPFGTMSLGLVVAALGSAVVAAASTSLIIYTGALLLGASAGVSNASGLRFFSTFTSDRRRAASIAVFSSLLLVGQASGPPIAAAISSFGSWRLAHAVTASLLLLFAIALLAARRRTPHSPQSSDEENQNKDSIPVGAAIKARIIYLVPFAIFGTFGAALHTLVPIIGDDLGLGIATIGVALGIGGGLRLVAILAGGRIADRFGRKAALVPAIAITSVGVALLSFASSYSVWLAAIISISVGAVAFSTSATVVADLSRPGRVGRNQGIWRFSGDLGLLVVPLTLGWAFESRGAVLALIPLSAALAVLAVATAVLVPETLPARAIRPGAPD